MAKEPRREVGMRVSSDHAQPREKMRGVGVSQAHRFEG